MAYWDEWSDDYKDELTKAGAVFNAAGVPVSGLNKAVAATSNIAGAVEFDETGSGSYLATVNEEYRTHQRQSNHPRINGSLIILNSTAPKHSLRMGHGHCGYRIRMRLRRGRLCSQTKKV